MKYEIKSEVKDGKISRNKNLISEAIQSFEGKQIIITIEKAKRKRSNPQNSFYHGVVIPIMQNALKESGNLMTNEGVHDLLKLRFLKESIMFNEETGECIERVKSTTELSTSQFMDFIAEIQQFASEYFGVIIPDPNEDLKLNLEQ